MVMSLLGFSRSEEPRLDGLGMTVGTFSGRPKSMTASGYSQPNHTKSRRPEGRSLSVRLQGTDVHSLLGQHVDALLPDKRNANAKHSASLVSAALNHPYFEVHGTCEPIIAVLVTHLLPH